MREKQKHIDAFDYFYNLGGAASAENCRLVAEKFQISERTFWNWYKKLGWKERVHLRNIDVGKKVEEKTNTTIADNKANYLSYVHKLFNDWKLKVDSGEVPVEIKSVSDVDKIVKLALLLQDEATDKTETSVTGNLNIKAQGLKRLRRIEAKHDSGDSGHSQPGGNTTPGEPGTETDPETTTSDK
ncbi:hypothetical protein [Methanobacterium sp.]|uniref:hypothetical protein n=1 Tax=Methanobacterium sp. TaxID=2164 RepID=UPI002ABCCAC8|nr:hypothetical protein [Methanobacterium sp.]MDY9922780.1 hypothetical protein [Methanobacterium sp.]